MDRRVEERLRDLKLTEKTTLESYFGIVERISRFTVPDREACYRRYAVLSLQNLDEEGTRILTDYAFVAHRQGSLPLGSFTSEFRAVLAYGLLKGYDLNGYLGKKAWLLLKETAPLKERIRKGLPRLEELLENLKEALPRMNEAFPEVVKDLR